MAAWDPRRDAVEAWLGLSPGQLQARRAENANALGAVSAETRGQKNKITATLVRPSVLQAFTSLREMLHFSRLAFEPGLFLDWRLAEFHTRFEQAYREFPRAELPWMNISAIFAVKERFVCLLTANLKAPIAARIRTQRNRRHLERFIHGYRHDLTLPLESANDTFARLIGGSSYVTSTAQRAAIEIAEKIRKNPALSEALIKAADSDFMRVLHASPPLERLVEDFVEVYGDQVAGDLNIETATQRHDLDSLATTLKALIADPKITVAAFNEEVRKSTGSMESQILSLISKKHGPLTAARKRQRFHALLKALGSGMAREDAIRSDLSRAVGVIRSVYRALGERLVEMGFIENAVEIFYLTTNEIEELFYGQSQIERPRDWVQLRAQQYQHWMKLKPEAQMRVTVPIAPALAARTDADRLASKVGTARSWPDSLAYAAAPLRDSPGSLDFASDRTEIHAERNRDVHPESRTEATSVRDLEVF